MVQLEDGSNHYLEEEVLVKNQNQEDEKVQGLINEIEVSLEKYLDKTGINIK